MVWTYLIFGAMELISDGPSAGNINAGFAYANF